METETETPTVSKRAYRGGWAMSIAPALLLLMSAVFKFLPPAGVEEGLQHIGWDASLMVPLGIVEAACAILYLIPRTSVLGAILCTAYMGGAIATHVRVDDPFYIQILIGVLIWGGLYLREPRVRALIPLRRAQA